MKKFLIASAIAMASMCANAEVIADVEVINPTVITFSEFPFDFELVEDSYVGSLGVTFEHLVAGDLFGNFGEHQAEVEFNGETNAFNSVTASFEGTFSQFSVEGFAASNVTGEFVDFHVNAFLDGVSVGSISSSLFGEGFHFTAGGFLSVEFSQGFDQLVLSAGNGGDFFGIDNFTFGGVTDVPEPTTLILFLLGACGLLVSLRKA